MTFGPVSWESATSARDCITLHQMMMVKMQRSSHLTNRRDWLSYGELLTELEICHLGDLIIKLSMICVGRLKQLTWSIPPGMIITARWRY